MGRANAKVQPQQRAPEPAPFRAPPQQQDAFDDQLSPAGGPPPWMARTPQAPRQTPLAQPDFPSEPPAHPLQRYPGEQSQVQAQYPQQQYRDEPMFDDRGRGQGQDARYDDALFGQLDTGGGGGGGGGFGRDEQYEDPYAFQDDGYDEGEEEEPRKGNGFAKVAVVLALAVIGTGAAFAYRSYMGTSRGGEPPIIRADNTPTKIIPAVPADGIPKLPDRMTNGDQGEKIVSREETPMDVNSRSVSPRVVFPPLNQNQNGNNPPPSGMGGGAMAANDITAPPVATDTPPPSSGGFANGEPRRIKTLSVHGDQADGGMPPGAPKAAANKGMGRNPPAAANASASGPMQIAPQQGASPPPAPGKKMAAVAPVAAAPAPAQDAADGAAADTMAGYLVQVSSQRSEADAQTSYRALQGKFPAVLGQRTPVIKRADLGEKGIYYRAMVGPFESTNEAVQFCNSLKTAGGQCVVQRK
jgi:hypothetical protein